jgi:hypothetical protein
MDEAALACAEECYEIRGPESCPQQGLSCEMLRRCDYPRLPPRAVLFTPEFVLAARAIVGDDDWWPGIAARAAAEKER